MTQKIDEKHAAILHAALATQVSAYKPNENQAPSLVHSAAFPPASKPAATALSESALRKQTPVASGVLDYFPDAINAVARVSFTGNEKHNPGQPLHWARGKSNDHRDCAVRHLMTAEQTDSENGLPHAAMSAWRALAVLQLELERRGEAPIQAARDAAKKG